MIVDCCDVGQTQLTTDTLPDDALLYIFDFYVAPSLASEVEAWRTLVQVCRRWRILVYRSPRRLNLRIVCTDKTPAVKGKLDAWPAQPVVISGTFNSTNIKAALEHHDRICQIKLFQVDPNIIASLEKPFPILTDLDLCAFTFSPPFNIDPSRFLGGSPHLRSLTLSGIWIPCLPKLLLSTPNLVILRLDQIRNSCLSDEMVAVLSSLTRLEMLDLEIEFDRPHPKLKHQFLPRLTCTVLPSLTMLKVTGNIESLEDFVAQINAPLLDHLYIILFPFPPFDRTLVLDTPQLLLFIGRTPKLRVPVEAYTGFNADKIWINLFHSMRISHHVLKLEIFELEPKREIPCPAQFCRSLPFPHHPLEDLYICGGERRQRNLTEPSEHARLLELLQPFAAVKNLYVTKEFASHIAHALQGLVEERVMEVLPTLKNVFIQEFELSGPVHRVIKEFVVARQLAGHPITISCWG